MGTEVWKQKVAMEVKREAAYVSVSSAIYAINNWVSGKHRSEKRNCPSVSGALLVHRFPRYHKHQLLHIPGCTGQV